MTIDEIHNEVSAVKPCSRRQVLRYLKQCSIAPRGVRQRPQIFPDDAALRIKIWLGFNGHDEDAGPVGEVKSPARGRRASKLVTMPALKRARKLSLKLRKATRSGRVAVRN